VDDKEPPTCPRPPRAALKGDPGEDKVPEAYAVWILSQLRSAWAQTRDIGDGVCGAVPWRSPILLMRLNRRPWNAVAKVRRAGSDPTHALPAACKCFQGVALITQSRSTTPEHHPSPPTPHSASHALYLRNTSSTCPGLLAYRASFSYYPSTTAHLARLPRRIICHLVPLMPIKARRCLVSAHVLEHPRLQHLSR